ncbi:MAG: hypothetical protein KIT33_02005 [Candidatus Kapabacteria bacterium]|nr:hypothetical protein [Ignavibacteriota bacterium]MCW5883726.1 hypothetical protein [Candidatus Kapabacteria bacterium]
MYKSILISFLLLAVSCSTDPPGHRFYYYPVEELANPKVYYYENVRDENDDIFYALKSFNDKGNKYIHIDIYNSNLDITKTERNIISGKGAFATELSVMIDSILTPLKVYSDTVFLWDMKSINKFKLEASTNRPETRAQFVIKKISGLTDNTGNFTFKNVRYNTIEIVQDNFQNDGTDNIDSEKIIYNYASGLGLVSFEINRTGSPGKSYILKEILTFNEWKRAYNP